MQDSNESETNMKEPVVEKWERDVLYHFRLFDGSHRDKITNFCNAMRTQGLHSAL